MGYYADYLNNLKSFKDIFDERKKVLKKISELRGNRDVLVIAADFAKGKFPIAIDYTDILPVSDLLSNLTGEKIDIILETPGGQAEVVEDVVRLLRDKYQEIGIIVLGWAKSAGTIFAMAGDEILMGKTSALGPIDAQIITMGKRFSADEFLEGFKDIKKDIEVGGKLNAVYIPILQNISLGDLKRCEHAQDLSKLLVSGWLVNYKFKDWTVHSSNNQPVTDDDKKKRADEIADILRSQSKWLTHGRSITIEDFKKMKVKITDYSKDNDLNDAITRYNALLRMTFDAGVYKLFETADAQIYRYIGVPTQLTKKADAEAAELDIKCQKCSKTHKIQMNFKKGNPLKEGYKPYPYSDNMFECDECGFKTNLSNIRLKIEGDVNKKAIE